MDLFTWIIVIFVLVFVLCIVAGIRGGERRASFRIGGTTVRTGRGRTDGAAVADGIRKICESVKSTSRVDTLETRLGLMRDAYAEYRYKMKESEREESLAQIRIVEGYLERRRKEESEREKRKKAIEEERMLERRERMEAEQAELRRVAPPYKSSPAFREKQRRLVTKALRYQVLQRDGFRCVLCGASAADGARLHVDHVVPVSRGGKTEMGNLRTLCEACNLGKGARMETPPPSGSPEAPADPSLPADSSYAPFAPAADPPPAASDEPDVSVCPGSADRAAVSDAMPSGVPVYDICPRKGEVEGAERSPVSASPVLAAENAAADSPDAQAGVGSHEKTDMPGVVSAGSDHDAVVRFLSERGVFYVDKTDRGGCLYFTDGSLAERLKRMGCAVYYAKNGARATKGAPAYFIRFDEKTR